MGDKVSTNLLKAHTPSNKGKQECQTSSRDNYESSWQTSWEIKALRKTDTPSNRGKQEGTQAGKQLGDKLADKLGDKAYGRPTNHPTKGSISEVKSWETMGEKASRRLGTETRP